MYLFTSGNKHTRTCLVLIVCIFYFFGIPSWQFTACAIKAVPVKQGTALSIYGIPLPCNKMHPVTQRITEFFAKELQNIFAKIFVVTLRINVITKVISHRKLQIHSWSKSFVSEWGKVTTKDGASQSWPLLLYLLVQMYLDSKTSVLLKTKSRRHYKGQVWIQSIRRKALFIYWLKNENEIKSWVFALKLVLQFCCIQSGLELTSRPKFATTQSWEQSLNSSCLRVTLGDGDPQVTDINSRGRAGCIAQLVFRTLF